VAHETVLVSGGVSLTNLIEDCLLVELLKLGLKVEVSHVLNIGRVPLSEVQFFLLPPAALLCVGFV
jgi:hypothetical protein